MNYEIQNYDIFEESLTFENLKKENLSGIKKQTKQTPFLALTDVNISEEKKKIIAKFLCTEPLPKEKELKHLIHYCGGYGAAGTSVLLLIAIAKSRPKRDFIQILWEKAYFCRPEKNREKERALFKKEVLKFSRYLYKRSLGNEKNFVSKIPVSALLENNVIDFSFFQKEEKPKCKNFQKVFPIKPYKQPYICRKIIAL